MSTYNPQLGVIRIPRPMPIARRPRVVPMRRITRRPMYLGDARQIETSAGVNAAAMAASFIPGVGPIISGVIKSFGSLFQGLFGQHAAKVKAEAGELNQIVPSFNDAITAIAQGYNSGQLSASDAISYAQQAVAAYYSGVSGGSAPIKGRWPVPAQGDPPNAKAPAGCNGPCVVGHFVEIDAFNLAHLLQSLSSQGTGASKTLNLTSLPSHAGFSGKPGAAVTFINPGGAGSLSLGSVGGIPLWILLVGGGLFLVFAAKG